MNALSKDVREVEAENLTKSRAQMGLPPYTAAQWAAWNRRWGK